MKYRQYIKRTVIGLSALTLLLSSTWTTFAESAVWKVKKDNAVMYLGGTVHLLRKSDFPLPEEFNKAYEASETVVFETDVEKVNNASAQQTLLKNARYAGESSLKKDLSEETYENLREYCASTKGASFAILKQFKPWFISVTLSSIELLNLGASPQLGVDKFFYDKAKEDGKTVEVFETPEEQIDFLTTMGRGTENMFIKYTLRDLKNLKEIYNELLKTWKNGNAERLNKLMVAELKKKFSKIHKRLITDRNAEWMPKIEQYMTTPETEFVLVGVAHLIGPDSIISTLKSKGCEVEKLKVE